MTTRSSTLKHPSRQPGFLLFGVVCLLVHGCGASDSARYPLAGQVTYKGQAVPEGTVVFNVVDSPEKQGPPGYAVIKQGRFDSREGGLGHFGGVHDVTILGYSGEAKSEDAPHGREMFPPITLRRSLETNAGEVDFDIK